MRENNVQRIPVCPVFVADAPLHRRKRNRKRLPNSVFFRSPTTSRSMTLHAQKATHTFRIPIIQPPHEKSKRLHAVFAHNFRFFTKTYRMGLVFIRTLIIFIATFFIMRLMGKRQIGEMQPYELVITLIISELACIPMGDPSIPLLYGIVAIVTIYLLHQIICLLDLNFRKAKKVLSGSPSILINKNGIDDTQLKANNLDVSDLIESLRTAGYFALDAVDYALYESEGNFSALPKQNYEQLQSSLPLILVDEGKFDDTNVQRTGKTRDYFLGILKEQGCDDVKKVLVMTVDGGGKVYLQKKGEKYKTFALDWKEKVW